MTSVQPRKFTCHQRVLVGCSARRASAGLAVANSNECNAVEGPPGLARREPPKKRANAVSSPCQGHAIACGTRLALALWVDSDGA